MVGGRVEPPRGSSYDWSSVHQLPARAFLTVLQENMQIWTACVTREQAMLAQGEEPSDEGLRGVLSGLQCSPSGMGGGGGRGEGSCSIGCRNSKGWDVVKRWGLDNHAKSSGDQSDGIDGAGLQGLPPGRGGAGGAAASGADGACFKGAWHKGCFASCHLPSFSGTSRLLTNKKWPC